LEVNVLAANLNTVHAANRKKFEEAKAQMLDRVEDAIEKAYAAKEKKAAEEKAAREKIAAEEKAGLEKRAAEERAAAKEKRAAEVKAAKEKKLAEEKAAKEKKAAEEKAAKEKRAAEERAAKEKRAAEVKAAKEKKAAEEKAAKEKKAEEENAAKEKKAAEEKAAKERRAAEEKASKGKRFAEEKAAMDKKAAAAQMAEDVLEMEMEWSDEQRERASEERVAAAIRAAAEGAAAERAAEEKAAASEKVNTPKPAKTNRKFRGLYSATHSPVELDEEVPLDTNNSGGVSGGRGKAGQAGAIKRVSFAKSVTKSPCYTANPLNKVSTSSGRKPTPVRPILNKSKDSDGKDSRQDTPVPRGRRTLSAAATKKSPAVSSISALKNPFGFDTSSEEDEDMFASNSRFAKKVTPAKPRRPAPIPLAKRLSTASSSKSPYKIFGSKNNTPTKETINSPKSPADDDSDF